MATSRKMFLLITIMIRFRAEVFSVSVFCLVASGFYSEAGHCRLEERKNLGSHSRAEDHGRGTDFDVSDMRI
jgi:hypothetical protein